MTDFSKAIAKVNAIYSRAAVSRWPNVHDSQPCNKLMWDRHVKALRKAEKEKRDAENNVTSIASKRTRNPKARRKGEAA